MCECNKKVGAGVALGNKEAITSLFRSGGAAVAAMHRRNICNHASPCRRWCERLIKGYGVGQVHCHDPNSSVSTPLHEALENSDWHCPLGLF